ncbi:MAG: Peptidase family S58 [Deltaproteobacteria bacterium ADurb.Bin510]|nr:MAG: Peptidase family S58 [Deltaproteobacteria bacterium ADurb.Bin510]
MVGAIVVANPFGDILNEQGRIIAGAHRDDGEYLNSLEALAGGEMRNPLKTAPANTTLAVVVTNARLDKAACQQVARMATCGLARHIAPFNTLMDGDLVICVSMGELGSHALTIGAMADLACARALLSAGDFKPIAELAS